MQKENLSHIVASKIVGTPLNHVSNSRKKVYLKSGDINGLTQFATIKFNKNDYIEPHEHKTMTEIFYVEYGEIEVTMSNESFTATTGDVIVAKSKHGFRFTNKTKLVYFGLEDRD